MNFREQTLEFTDKKIYYIDSKTGEEIQVMMDWEDELMKKSAEYVCENGGDILEIGFGMGISANYIQSHNIKSHTIIEYHPQVYNKAQIWAEDKPNVNLILGDWKSSLNLLSTYDGIFYDTFGDDNFKLFGDLIKDYVNEGANVTWWNDCLEEKNIFGWDNVIYDWIPTKPTSNNYFKSSVYFLPKKKF
tara:strand:+ start:102 stop:668 length:567 start_codon:yes stop_codon:yes gene_type:complete